MKSIFEHLRNSRDNRLGIQEVKPKLDEFKMKARYEDKVKSLYNLVELAKSRLIMGGIRYGVNKHKDHQWVIGRMTAKFEEYKTTGNAEMLVDLANYCAIEMTDKTHPNYHFEAEDRED